VANASQFGLSGNLWTRDVELARKVVRDLHTDGVFINGVTAADPRVPVGGVKNSVYGRELSHFGAHAFVNAQTVWIEMPRYSMTRDSTHVTNETELLPKVVDLMRA
jgi:succinate-semialdehyde dehydrogenase